MNEGSICNHPIDWCMQCSHRDVWIVANLHNFNVTCTHTRCDDNQKSMPATYVTIKCTYWTYQIINCISVLEQNGSHCRQWWKTHSHNVVVCSRFDPTSIKVSSLTSFRQLVLGRSRSMMWCGGMKERSNKSQRKISVATGTSCWHQPLKTFSFRSDESS